MLPVLRDAAQTQSQSYSTPIASGPVDDFTVAGFAGVLRRHRLLLLTCVVVAVALAAAYTMYSTPVYEASSMLRVDEQQVNLPQLVQQVSTENEINTEIEVLQRRSAAIPVIDSLALRARLVSPRNGQLSKYFALLELAPHVDTTTLVFRPAPNGRFSISRAGDPSTTPVVSARVGDTVSISGLRLALLPTAKAPEQLKLQITSVDAAVRAFGKMLKVTRPTRDADLIAIQVKSSDPNQAAAAANVLADEVITNRQDVQLARTGSTVGFLRQQLDTLGTQLRSAEDRLQAYRQNARVVDADEQARTQVGRLAQVQADRAGVEAERQALSQLLQQMRTDSARSVASGGLDSSRARRLIAFPTLFRNQAASELLGSLAQIENERSTLLTRRTAQDPDVQALTNRIHSLDAQLQGIAETYLQGLTNQVAALETEVKGFGGSLDSLPAKQVQTARLERAVRVQQELYTLIQTRLKEAEITEAMKDPSIRVVDRAVAPEKPTWPNPKLNFALAPLLGLLLGVALALVRESTDGSVRSRADALLASGLPILGAIPRLRRPNRLLRGMAGRARLRAGHGNAENGKHSPRLPMARAAASIGSLFATDPDAPADYVEAFNHLHANLELAYEDRPVRSLVITSPLPGEGKTLTAVNYALTLAAQGYRVLLIDADLRCGLVNEIFGCPREPGVTEILRDVTDFATAAQRVNVGGGGVLTILPSGARGPTPGRLLVVDKLRDLLGGLQEQFDHIIIDSPPINLLADAALLGAASDAVLLVVRAGHTRFEELRYAMDQLTAARAPVIGTLLNDIDPNRRADDESYRYLEAVNRYADNGEGLARLGR